MPAKSVTYEKKWWIPDSELKEKTPTAFLISQMSKKDFDIERHKSELESVVRMVQNGLRQEEAPDSILASSQIAESGFDEAIYRRCVHEIRNVFVGDEFVESIKDPEEIISFIAGMEDQVIGDQLDAILWRRSTLTEFESENFTPTSGCNTVCKITPDEKNKKVQTANNASTETAT